MGMSYLTAFISISGFTILFSIRFCMVLLAVTLTALGLIFWQASGIILTLFVSQQISLTLQSRYQETRSSILDLARLVSLAIRTDAQSFVVLTKIGCLKTPF